MLVEESIQSAISSIKNNGVRSFLTALAIIIGTAAVIAVIGIGSSAEKALEWGLINRLYEDSELLNETIKLAKELSKGPMSLGLIRKAFWDSFDNSYEEQLNLERDLQFIAGQSDDFKEGVKAFLEKRDAKFNGK